jgi:hypothetical protein
MRLKIQKAILIASIFLYIAALFSPTLEEFDLLDNHPEILPGYLVFVWGWYAVSFLHFAWFGNVTWAIGTILFFKKRYTGFYILSLATSAFCIDSYFYPSERYLGFYLWNIALNLPLLVAVLNLVTKKSPSSLPST